MSPEAYVEVNPPFPIPPAWMHKMRPVAEWPHDRHRTNALAGTPTHFVDDRT